MIYGLTGGIGCGKSTVSQIMLDAGIPVWDADLETHALYRSDPAALVVVGDLFPDAVTEETIDRARLSDLVFHDEENFRKLQHYVHRRLTESVEEFIADTPLGVIDVPLLFEAGFDKYCQHIIVVHCPVEVQRERVLKRGMSEAKFDEIIRLQCSNEYRLSRADIAFDTSGPKEVTRARVHQFISEITNK